jgi:hypothetical protein
MMLFGNIGCLRNKANYLAKYAITISEGRVSSRGVKTVLQFLQFLRLGRSLALSTLGHSISKLGNIGNLQPHPLKKLSQIDCLQSRQAVHIIHAKEGFLEDSFGNR